MVDKHLLKLPLIPECFETFEESIAFLTGWLNAQTNKKPKTCLLILHKIIEEFDTSKIKGKKYVDIKIKSYI